MYKKTWLYTYFIVTCGLLAAGYMFEEPYGHRMLVLLGLMAVYTAVLLFSVLNNSHINEDHGGEGSHSLTSVVTVIMTLLLIAIEFYSKYAVNYFFHSIYILLIFYCIILMPSKTAIGVSAFVTLLSFIKFAELIFIQTNFANIALLVFFGSVQVLVVVTGVFLRVYREETEKTKRLYSELLKSHEQLKVYADEIRGLSQMEARNRIARDLHDTLGHELTGLIMQIEMAGNHFSLSEAKDGMAMLQSSKTSARESLVKVREIVETLKNDEGPEGGIGTIEQMVNDFARRTGCGIRYVERGDRALPPSGQLVLYRVVQESLTNAIRHGQAGEIFVTLIFGSDEVSFEISNDGKAVALVNEGNGIKGMRERLSEIGGKLFVEGAPVFRVWGVIPYGEQ